MTTDQMVAFLLKQARKSAKRPAICPVDDAAVAIAKRASKVFRETLEGSKS